MLLDASNKVKIKRVVLAKGDCSSIDAYQEITWKEKSLAITEDIQLHGLVFWARKIRYAHEQRRHHRLWRSESIRCSSVRCKDLSGDEVQASFVDEVCRSSSYQISVCLIHLLPKMHRREIHILPSVERSPLDWNRNYGPAAKPKSREKFQVLVLRVARLNEVVSATFGDGVGLSPLLANHCILSYETVELKDRSFDQLWKIKSPPES